MLGVSILLGTFSLFCLGLVSIDTIFNCTAIPYLGVSEEADMEYLEEREKMPRKPIRWFPAFVCSFISTLVFCVLFARAFLKTKNCTKVDIIML